MNLVLRSTALLAGLAAGAAVLATSPSAHADPAAASAPDPQVGAPAAMAGPAAIRLTRNGHDVFLTASVSRAGEGLLDLGASSPEADWSSEGRESAVVSIGVDGWYATDLVIPSARRIARQFAVGPLTRGRHTIRLHYSNGRSAKAVNTADLSRVRLGTVDKSDPDYLAAKFNPVLYGRNLAGYGGVYANATTDTPLVAWHDIQPATTAGHVIVQTSYIWSNEDGGTDTARLMARWGRTTDIEWIYRVEVDQHGDRVPGSDTFQAPSHTTTTFHGTYEGTHAVLDTCTENNNVCDKRNDPMRFWLSNRQSLPAGQPREQVMDANPWTYQVMAAEMRREGKLEAHGSPATAAVSDQRNYLFLAVKKDTVPVTNDGVNWVGLGVGVTLRGSNKVYRSDHIGTGGATDWSIQRDDPAATTVELPPGTTAADIATIRVYRVVNGTADPGNAVHATQIIRGFFLGRTYLPQPSFLSWNGSVTVTAQKPSATIWSSGSTRQPRT